MVRSQDEIVSHAEVVVIGNRAPEFRDVAHLLRPGQAIVDLVRLAAVRNPAEVRAELPC